MEKETISSRTRLAKGKSGGSSLGNTLPLPAILILATICLATVSCQTPDSEICRYYQGREAAVSLTFDDGIIDHYTLVAAQLNRLGMQGTFWVNAAFMGEDETRLTWDMCRKMAAAGHEISNHAWSHKNLYNISDEEILQEISLCDEAIARELGAAPITFCFPYNAYDERTLALAMKGRVGARTYQEAQGQANTHSTPESLSRWLRGVIDGGEWGVTMTHGIHIGWDQWEDENVLWRFYRELSGKRDSVWVDVFAHVASYITERDNCTLSVKKCGSKLILRPSCSLDPSLYRQPLTARVRLGEAVLYLDFDPFGGRQTYDLGDPLLGRTVNVFGDSYVRNHNEPMQNTWHYKVAARHSMVYNNYGINGSSVAFDRSDRGFGVSMLDRFAQMSHKADYILVVAGHNDAFYITEHPDSTDVLMERLDLFCRGLKEQYPGAKLGFVTPWAVDKPNFPEVIAAIHHTCDKYGIKVLDAAVTSGIEVDNPDFRKRYFQRPDDTAHLNAAGHDLLVDWGDAFLRSL